MDTLEERIRRRAYEIWEREGRMGRPEDHWYRAEREVAGSAPEGSEATVEAAPPVSAVEASQEIGDASATDSAAGSKKPRRKRTS
jgi:hypothetical protein